MYLQKVISRKTYFLNQFIVNLLKDDDEIRRIRIRIHTSEALIRGSGYTQKCHGSATLLKGMLPAPKPVVAGCEKRPPPAPACEVVVVPNSPPPGWLVRPKAPAGLLKAVLPPKAKGWAA
jgi:hypothetical protein